MTVDISTYRVMICEACKQQRDPSCLVGHKLGCEALLALQVSRSCKARVLGQRRWFTFRRHRRQPRVRCRPTRPAGPATRPAQTTPMTRAAAAASASVSGLRTTRMSPSTSSASCATGAPPPHVALFDALWSKFIIRSKTSSTSFSHPSDKISTHISSSKFAHAVECRTNMSFAAALKYSAASALVRH